MTAVWMISIPVGSAAVIEDLLHRRISNWTSGGALLSGCTLGFIRQGWHGALGALCGAAVGFAVFLIFYLLHGMGGGDLKLMAGFGSLLGPAVILQAAWLAAVAGGLITIGLLSVRALMRRRYGVSQGAERAEFIPYAPAIVAGAWIALLGQR
jgi:prepilin peptidase CpaA